MLSSTETYELFSAFGKIYTQAGIGLHGGSTHCFCRLCGIPARCYRSLTCTQYSSSDSIPSKLHRWAESYRFCHVSDRRLAGHLNTREGGLWWRCNLTVISAMRITDRIPIKRAVYSTKNICVQMNRKLHKQHFLPSQGSNTSTCSITLLVANRSFPDG